MYLKRLNEEGECFPIRVGPSGVSRAWEQGGRSQVDRYRHRIGACQGERDFPAFEHLEAEGVCESQVDNPGAGVTNQGEPSVFPGQVKGSEAGLSCLLKVGG